MAGGNAGQVAQMVRSAIKSAQALPENAQAFALLKSKVVDAAKAPHAGAASPIPSMATSISGAVYEFPVNSSRLDSLSLTVSKTGEARLDGKYYGEPLSFPVGLNGVYRLSPSGPFHLVSGAMGKWTTDSEFLLDLNFVANINHYTLDIRFHDDQMDVTASEASGLIRNGHLTGKRKP
jgi:hypothetical protein